MIIRMAHKPAGTSKKQQAHAQGNRHEHICLPGMTPTKYSNDTPRHRHEQTMHEDEREK